MGIESNKEAYQMVKNTLGSIENRFREAYNKGYKDGLRDGASQVTAKLVSKILEETDADTPQTDAEITELAKEIVHKMIDNSDIAEDAYPNLRQKMHEAVERLDEYYPSEHERSE